MDGYKFWISIKGTHIHLSIGLTTTSAAYTHHTSIDIKMSGSPQEERTSPSCEKSLSGSSTDSNLGGTDYFQAGQDLSHWEDSQIFDATEKTQPLSGGSPASKISHSPDFFHGSQDDSLELYTTASEDIFSSKKAANISEDLFATEEEILSSIQSKDESYSQDISTQELYTHELYSDDSIPDTQDSIPDTQEETKARCARLNKFATSFHKDSILHLQNLAQPIKPDLDVIEYRYVVLCSQMIEKYIASKFPNDPKERNQLRNKIQRYRENLFGTYIDQCDEDSLDEPQPGTSGLNSKRPMSEKTTSPQKKVRKDDSDHSDLCDYDLD